MATRGKKEKEYPPMPANWMYKRGDVYMMDLNPYSGSEQGGIRPADRKSTRLNSSHYQQSRMPSSA